MVNALYRAASESNSVPPQLTTVNIYKNQLVMAKRGLTENLIVTLNGAKGVGPCMIFGDIDSKPIRAQAVGHHYT